MYRDNQAKQYIELGKEPAPLYPLPLGELLGAIRPLFARSASLHPDKKRRRAEALLGHDIDVRAVLPDLGSFLTIHTPAKHILPRLNVLRDDHLVSHRPEGPVTGTPAFML